MVNVKRQQVSIYDFCYQQTYAARTAPWPDENAQKKSRRSGCPDGSQESVHLFA